MLLLRFVAVLQLSASIIPRFLLEPAPSFNVHCTTKIENSTRLRSHNILHSCLLLVGKYCVTLFQRIHESHGPLGHLPQSENNFPDGWDPLQF